MTHHERMGPVEPTMRTEAIMASNRRSGIVAGPVPWVWDPKVTTKCRAWQWCVGVCKVHMCIVCIYIIVYIYMCIYIYISYIVNIYIYVYIRFMCIIY